MERSNELTNEVLQSLLLLKHTSNADCVDSQAASQEDLKSEGSNNNMNDEDTSSQNSNSSVSTSTASIGCMDDSNTLTISSSNTNTAASDTHILRPNDKDILSGRGTGVNAHPGNVFFRDLIQANKQSYFNAKPPEKKLLIKRIVEAAQANGHRFLKLDPSSEMWTRLTFNEARRKTAQALRENASQLKKRLQQEKLRGKLMEEKERDQQRAVAGLGSKFAVKRKLDDIRCNSSTFESNDIEPQEKNQKRRPLSTSHVYEELEDDFPPKFPARMPPHMHDISHSLSMRLKILKEKQTIVKQLEKEIMTEQRALMRDLLAATQVTPPSWTSVAQYTSLTEDTDFLQSMKRRKLAAENAIQL